MAHQPTEVTRALAFGLTVNGVTKKQVARHLNIDVKTLAAHYGPEVELGLEKASAQVANALLRLALKPSAGMPSFNAMKLWSIGKAGWSEKTALAVDLRPDPEVITYPPGESPREKFLAKIEAMADRDPPGPKAPASPAGNVIEYPGHHL